MHAYRDRKRKVPFVRYYIGNSNLGITLLYESDRKLPDFLLVPQYPTENFVKKLSDVLLSGSGVQFLQICSLSAHFTQENNYITCDLNR